jgi:hypothetical protein
MHKTPLHSSSYPTHTRYTLRTHIPTVQHQNTTKPSQKSLIFSHTHCPNHTHTYSLSSLLSFLSFYLPNHFSLHWPNPISNPASSFPFFNIHTTLQTLNSRLYIYIYIYILYLKQSHSNKLFIKIKT